jgi:nucleotide-binding universal stress UspA family protein
MKNANVSTNRPSSKPASSQGPILWAIDPTETGVRPNPAALEILSRCAGEGSRTILPLYIVASASQKEGAQREAAAYVQDLGGVRVGPVQALVAGSDTRRGAVESLLGVAAEREAPCIAVSSHGRSGPSRWFLGSFAERLLEASPIPILFLSRGGSGVAPEPTMLFATDFSARSRAAFDAALTFAKQAGLKVILYYESTIPVIAAGDLGMSGIPAALPADYLETQRDWAVEQGAAWASGAAALGVPVEVEVQVGGFNVAGGILNMAARRKVAVIAMASTSSLLSRALMGGVTREVFREGTCPVWLYGPGIR